MSATRTAIPPGDILQDVPLFDVRGSMDLSTLQDYRNLARLLLLRGELTREKARRLFDAIHQLNIFLSVDLQPLQDIGARPVGDTLTRFYNVRAALIKEFNEIGLSAANFRMQGVEMDHPSNIFIN